MAKKNDRVDKILKNLPSQSSRNFETDSNEEKSHNKFSKPFYKNMWFWIAIVLAFVVVGTAVGNGDDGEVASESTTVETSASQTNENEESKEVASTKIEETEEAETKSNADEQYQAVLDEYTIKLQEATPGLIDEYNAEYPENEDGLEGLADLSNSKVEQLAELSNEGTEKMASVYQSSGSGSYEEYENWAKKLYKAYEEEAGKIMDVYMESAQ